MVTLIKKGRKKANAEPVAEETTSTEMVAVADPHAEDAAGPGRAAMNYSPPTPGGANMPRSYGTTSGYDVGASYAPPDGADDFQLPARHIAAEPPPSPEPDTGRGGLLSRVLLFTGEKTAAERDRAAAEEFEQAIAPVMEYMRAAVPEASTPEEAARILSENQGEITPDPKGGSYVPGDAFDADARVYYRLLRRNYEKTPRPSEKRPESRALSGSGGSDGYRLLPGTRGW
ncbi:MAG: hypothetical protein ACR2KK_01600 [Acidimicrobiales bacterium]